MIEYPEEFEDYKKVMDMGAEKHGANNWLQPDGSKSSFKQMHDSMFHHLAESYAQGEWLSLRGDEESDLDPLLHLICRAQMVYTRLKKNITHPEDQRGGVK